MVNTSMTCLHAAFDFVSAIFSSVGLTGGEDDVRGSFYLRTCWVEATEGNLRCNCDCLEYVRSPRDAVRGKRGGRQERGSRGEEGISVPLLSFWCTPLHRVRTHRAAPLPCP